MKFELNSQEVQFTFGNEKYKSGFKTRTFKHIKEGAEADKLKAAGEAIAGLQNDTLSQTVLVQKQLVSD